ncbi:MAG TPA: cupin domain-containing protein [Acidobacteriaceae bacterium]|jgi:quercetin dioxygenase-like cupin family protein|nr:cupin domain-containing protein [Acidobacteriaceae bacterium]
MNEQPLQAAVLPAEEIRLGGIFLRFMIDSPSTGRGLSLFEMTVQPAARVPIPHHHEGFDETVYGVSATLRMMLNGQKIDLGPGDSLYIPRGAVHGFENPHAEPARVLIVITPGDRFGAQYFRDLAAMLAAGGPPDPQAMIAVMMRYGLIPARI